MAYLNDPRFPEIKDNGTYQDGCGQNDYYYWNGSYQHLCGLSPEQYATTIFYTQEVKTSGDTDCAIPKYFGVKELSEVQESGTVELTNRTTETTVRVWFTTDTQVFVFNIPVGCKFTITWGGQPVQKEAFGEKGQVTIDGVAYKQLYIDTESSAGDDAEITFNIL